LTKGDALARIEVDLHALAIGAPEREFRFDPKRRWRFDFCWPARKIAVEVDGGTWIGGRHVQGAGFENDCRKMNAAVLAGWDVYRFTTDMVLAGEAFTVLEDAFA
jgi:very-short-patch-repair endonuclease